MNPEVNRVIGKIETEIQRLKTEASDIIDAINYILHIVKFSRFNLALCFSLFPSLSAFSNQSSPRNSLAMYSNILSIPREMLLRKAILVESFINIWVSLIIDTLGGEILIEKKMKFIDKFIQFLIYWYKTETL